MQISKESAENEKLKTAKSICERVQHFTDSYHVVTDFSAADFCNEEYPSSRKKGYG